MIRFALRCAAGHDFEAWFASSATFEAQREAGEIACPVCGGVEVEKALMRPAVATARGREELTLAAHTSREAEMRAAIRKLRDEVTRNSEDVGDRFADEARKIHYEETEHRGIYGRATPDEARSLAEEGIAFAPLPVLPDDHN